MTFLQIINLLTQEPITTQNALFWMGLLQADWSLKGSWDQLCLWWISYPLSWSWLAMDQMVLFIYYTQLRRDHRLPRKDCQSSGRRGETLEQGSLRQMASRRMRRVSGARLTAVTSPWRRETPRREKTLGKNWELSLGGTEDPFVMLHLGLLFKDWTTLES